MALRQLAFRVFLALLLVLAQQHAALHLLGHAFEDLSHKAGQSAPSDEGCEKCLALAHLDNVAAPGEPVLLSAPVVSKAAPIFAVSRPDCAPRAPYLSRAPPSIS